MRNRSRLLDIIDKSYSGPACDEHEFDMAFVAAGVTRVVKKHGIKLDKSRIVQSDDDMNDRIWQAGVEFLESCGVYNTSTGRRMVFTRREIEEWVKSAPREAIIGEGRDARLERHRRVEDLTPPIIIGGPIGTPLSEDLYVPIMQSYIQEPIIDTTTPGTLDTTFGRQPRTRSPYEVVAAWEEVEMIFTAARRAGRPGMSIGCVQMGISEVGHLSAISWGGYRPVDWHSIAMFSEMKTNNDLLIKTAHSVRTDGIIQSFYNPILGGLGGGEEGLAVLIAAGLMAMQIIYMATTHSTAPVAAMKSATTLPQVLRPISAAIAGLSRNTPMMTDVMTSPLSGPCTTALLFECVAAAIVATTCGVARLMGVRSAAGVVLNHCTGLEARFNGEVGYAALGLSREEGNRIVKLAVAEYEPALAVQQPGKPFQEAYDLTTLHPTPEWQAMYDDVKERTAGWGLHFM